MPHTTAGCSPSLRSLRLLRYPHYGRVNVSQILVNNFAEDNKTYEKYLLGQANFDETLPDTIKKQAVLAVKDEWTCEITRLVISQIRAKCSAFCCF
jgi:hypothetical protein